jgi:hemolysin-activating ACP:hemolysin acyltransferase
MKSQIVVADKSSEAATLQAVPIGFVASILRASKAHSHYPVSYIRDLIEPALAHRLIKLYFNQKGDPVGYVVWAYVAEDVQTRFLQTGKWDLHESEWREGRSLWIVDFVAPFGHTYAILKDLRDHVFPKERELCYYRIKNGKMIAKSVSRDDRCSFFKRRE